MMIMRLPMIMTPSLRQDQDEYSGQQGGGAKDDQRNHRRGCETQFSTWFSLITIHDKVITFNDKVITINDKMIKVSDKFPKMIRGTAGEVARPSSRPGFR